VLHHLDYKKHEHLGTPRGYTSTGTYVGTYGTYIDWMCVACYEGARLHIQSYL